MTLSPESILMIHHAFFALVFFTAGYSFFGILDPISIKPTLLVPGPALPVGLSIILVFFIAGSLLNAFLPFPPQYYGKPPANYTTEFALFSLFGLGAGLGYWKPLVR